MTGKKLFVGNLGWTVTEEQLSDFFSKVGKVDSTIIVLDRETGRSRGFGFVEMASISDAENALANLEGKMLGDRQIRISEAKPETKREGYLANIETFIRNGILSGQLDFTVGTKHFVLTRNF